VGSVGRGGLGFGADRFEALVSATTHPAVGLHARPWHAGTRCRSGSVAANVLGDRVAHHLG
jgi:hypothetical protein